MAPYIGPEALKGVQSHESLRTAEGFATADALQTLKAVQDLIGTYFAKNTPPGPCSAPRTLTPDVPSPDSTVKDDEPCIAPASPKSPGTAEGVSSIAVTQPSSSAVNGGVTAGSPLTSAEDHFRGAIKVSDPATPLQDVQDTIKSAGSVGVSTMASAEINGTTNGHGKPPGTGVTDGTNGVASSKPQPGPGSGPKPGPPPLNKEHLRFLAASISSSIDQLTTSDGPDAKAAHMKAAAAALELTASLRAPPEVIMSWFSTASVVSAVRLFLEWGVFDAIPPGPHGISFSELAEKVKAEESLLVRVSWMLTSNSILKHVSSAPVGLSHTPISMLLRTGQPMNAMFKLMYTNIVEVSTILPPYFSTYGRREPLGPAHIPTSFLAGQPHLEYFEHLNQDPARIQNFMLAMGITHRNVPTTGMYPMDSVIAAASASPSRPIWVDIGGGDGHTVKLFLQTYPLPASQCIVQDLPEVVSAAQSQISASADSDLAQVRFLPMDFHRDPPVAGARCYYLRHILRDYSDPTAINILKNLKKGLTEEDSRILIAEQVIEDPPAAYAAFKDYAMLAIGGKERTLEGFKGIAEAAGLEVSGVFRDKVQAAHAVVEMKVKV